jgi:aspartyl-tRNA(Asn)/glutamyl-tRNA(Gln) amidotransferase subunit A
MALSWTLDKLGPLARSAEDCALVLEAMAGPDAHDATSARRRFRHQPLPVEELRRLRLGFAPADFEELAAEAARPIFAEALRALRGLGARFAEAALPQDLPYGPVVSAIIGAEAGSIFGHLIESDAFQQLVDAKQKEGLRADLAITARDYLQAMRIRMLVQEAFRALFRRVDVLVGVGRPGPASRLDQPLDSRPSSLNPATAPPDRPANPALIPAGNLAGLPAVCVPCGFTTDGLPLAIQFVGPPFSENTLLALANWFQTQTDWHRRRPPDLNFAP